MADFRIAMELISMTSRVARPAARAVL